MDGALSRMDDHANGRTASPMIRGLTRIWRVRPPVEAGPGPVSLVERVLASRGLSDPADARRFLRPSLRDLHEPSLMPGLDAAAGRLLSGADRAEPIVIYGDYDVDGVTASAILFRTLAHLRPGAPLSTFVPHRLEEGYGLSADAISELASRGARVVVSVDCGITAHGPARTARESGVDLIITDHHSLPPERDGLPPAYACVHPRLPGSVYPFGDLSGAGVAYKLAWRMCTMSAGSERVDEPTRALLLDLLALAALGTIADVVPLVGENRVIAAHGLSRVRAAPFVGLRALIRAAKLEGVGVSAQDVGFKLGPRLNAVGRLGHAREAVELLITGDETRATAIASELTRLNDERRDVQDRIFGEACTLAESTGMTSPDRRAIVLASESWHAGVVGIVCSKLVERYGRPSLLLARAGDACHGSGRSIDGFDLAGALSDCADLLTSSGGHRMAAGLRLSAGNFAAFTERFTAIANDRLRPDQLFPSLHVDTDASLEELSTDAVRELESLAPFGAHNPPVRVRLTGVEVAENVRRFGRNNAHGSVKVRSAPGGSPVRLVGWRWGTKMETLARGERIDAVVSPRVSSWNNGAVEPEIDDLRSLGAGSPAVTPAR